MAEWGGTELLLEYSVSKENEPEVNVQVLFERLLAVRASPQTKFAYVLAVYIGKTASILHVEMLRDAMSRYLRVDVSALRRSIMPRRHDANIRGGLR